MGDPKGFLKVERTRLPTRPVAERLRDFAPVDLPLEPEALREQASRCMDCGIPFCHDACPVENVIPEFNDLVFSGDMENAERVLEATNNFPEITGRVCPAPCEGSCVLAIDNAPVHIKAVERSVGDYALARGLRPARLPAATGRRIAIVGSGPAGLAAAQQLARLGHGVVVFERDNRIGGLLRYGIPDFKLDKAVIDARLAQMRSEGIDFRPNTDVGHDISPSELMAEFDAIVLCVGSRVPRDLPIPGRKLEGVHFAMEFLQGQNQTTAGDFPSPPISAAGKNVVVIGGGDTGSDCVGTSNRHRAASVVQLEIAEQPPATRGPSNPWPDWPLVLRTSSSHEEGVERRWSMMTTEFVEGDRGRVKAMRGVYVERDRAGRFVQAEGEEWIIPCDLALLAMGFVGPEPSIAEAFGARRDDRGNIATDAEGRTSAPTVFAAGDASRGQSLVVWAIADGRRVAAGVHAMLVGPRHRRLSVVPSRPRL